MNANRKRTSHRSRWSEVRGKNWHAMRSPFRSRFEQLEERCLLTISLPGMELMDPSANRFDGQTVYLDFDGEEDVTYRGPVTVEGIDVPAFLGPANSEGQEDAIIADIVEILTSVYADSGVDFVTAEPIVGVAYSTVYVGGDDSRFAAFGSFLGLAENIDIGNVIPDDKAFIFSDGLVASLRDPADVADVVASLIAHEVGHLLGLEHTKGSMPVDEVSHTKHPLGLLDDVAYGQIVHQHIVTQAIGLFNERFGDTWNQDDFIHPQFASPRFGKEMYDAVSDEDGEDAPWGGDTYLGIGPFPFLEHFFDPTRSDSSDHLDHVGLIDLSFVKEDASALDRMELYWNGVDDYPGIIGYYEDGNATEAWHYLGHAAHLVADMTVPAHVQLDPHAPFVENLVISALHMAVTRLLPPYIAVPWFVGDDQYETYLSKDDNYANWGYETGMRGADDLKTSAIEEFSSVDSLFRRVAGITDHFDSDAVDGEYTGDDDINSGELENSICEIYADTLLVNAVRFTLSLFDMFISEVQPSIAGSAPARASANVEVDVTPNGAGNMGIQAVDFQVLYGGSWVDADPDIMSWDGWDPTISLARFQVGTDVEIRARVLDQGGLYSDWKNWTVLKEFAGDPQSLVLSVNVSPDSNVGAYSPVTASGWAYYDNGDIVPTGAVVIDNGTSMYTAAINNGHFSQLIEAPGSTRDVVFTAYESVYGFFDTANHTVTVEGSHSGSDYRLEAVDVIYDRESDGNGVTWWSKDAFGSDDAYVETLVYLENVYDELQIRWRYYRPDGSQYGDTQYYTVPDPKDSGWEYWNWYWASKGYLIDGYETSFAPGLYTSKVWIDDGSGWDLVATRRFSFLYNFTEHRMAEDVQDSSPFNPINPTTTFYTDSDDAYTWGRLEWVAQDLDVKWDWYEPNGNLFTTSTYSIPHPDSQGDVQWNWYNVWGSIPIAGYSATNKPGDWHVDVFVEDPVFGGWDSIYTDYFQILERPAFPPNVSASLSDPDPVEANSVSINVAATDNTYLDSVTVYWDDGNIHSSSWSDLYSGTFSSSVSLGTLLADACIEYWAVATDTSGNTFTSEHKTFTLSPVAPTALTAEPISSRRVRLSWQDQSNIESGFRIERRPEGGNWTLIATVGADATTYLDASLTAETRYEYRAQAYTASHDSEWSNVTNATTFPGVKINEIDLGNRTLQRSTIRSIFVEFNDDVSGSLTKESLLVNNLSTGSQIQHEDMQVDYDASSNTAIWTFPGLGDEELDEGNYQCTLVTDSVTNASGNEMEQGQYDFDFHVLPGDATGDRRVNIFDLRLVRQNYLIAAGTERNDSADVNSDGAINIFDLREVRQNYLEMLEVPYEILVFASEVTVPEGGTAQFAVSISAEPLGTITVTVARSDGDEDLNVGSDATLTFDRTNWYVPQTVTISASEDADAINGTALFKVLGNGATNQPAVTAAEDDNDIAGNFADDFEDSEIDASLWLFGGSRRAWAPWADRLGNWNYSHAETVYQNGDPDGYLQVRVYGPTSANTYGAEAWVRTTYDYNDAHTHIIDFTWEAEVTDSHYNHYLVQITDGYVPPQSYNYLEWPQEEPRLPECGATIDLLWHTDAQGNSMRGEFWPSGLAKTTWSILVDPSGMARLYNGPRGTGMLVREEVLPLSQPWYLRWMVSDGTSGGFPAGDARLNLYAVSSVSIVPLGGDGEGESPAMKAGVSKRFLSRTDWPKATSGVDAQTRITANEGGYEGMYTSSRLSKSVFVGVDSISSTSLAKPTASTGRSGGGGPGPLRKVRVADSLDTVASVNEPYVNTDIEATVGIIFWRVPVQVVCPGFNPRESVATLRPVASPLTTSVGEALAVRGRLSDAESPVTGSLAATEGATELPSKTTQNWRSWVSDPLVRKSRLKWLSAIDQALTSWESWSEKGTLPEELGKRKPVPISPT